MLLIMAVMRGEISEALLGPAVQCSPLGSQLMHMALLLDTAHVTPCGPDSYCVSLRGLKECIRVIPLCGLDPTAHHCPFRTMGPAVPPHSVR